MTHHIQHQYDEILQADLPGLEIHVIYNCESEIEFGNDGEEVSNRLISISVSVDGKKSAFAFLPRETDGKDAREFLARLRESARQALYAEALRQAEKAAHSAERWMRTGSTKLPVKNFGKPEQFYG